MSTLPCKPCPGSGADATMPQRCVQGWTRMLHSVIHMNQHSNMHANKFSSVAKPTASLHGFISHVCLRRNRSLRRGFLRRRTELNLIWGWRHTRICPIVLSHIILCNFPILRLHSNNSGACPTLGQRERMLCSSLFLSCAWLTFVYRLTQAACCPVRSHKT